MENVEARVRWRHRRDAAHWLVIESTARLPYVRGRVTYANEYYNGAGWYVDVWSVRGGPKRRMRSGPYRSIEAAEWRGAWLMEKIAPARKAKQER